MGMTSWLHGIWASKLKVEQPKCGDKGGINGWQEIYWDHSIN